LLEEARAQSTLEGVRIQVIAGVMAAAAAEILPAAAEQGGMRVPEEMAE
jgi:hypothetical protein